MNTISSPTSDFLNNSGCMGKLIQQHDWSTGGLGSPFEWSMSLKSITSVILRSRFPMFLAWGKDLTFIYNDAYSEILGNKHPSALGDRFEDIWGEIWETISPIVSSAMKGESCYFENMPLVVTRNGFDEIAWFTFSYSPALADNGEVAGIYCVCNETTKQVLAERRREQEIGRLSDLFRQAPGFIAVVKEPNHVFEVANDSYLRLIGKRDVIGKPFRDAMPELADQGYNDILDSVFLTGKPYIGRAISVRLRRFQDAPMEEYFLDLLFEPVKDATGTVSGIFIQGNDVSQTVRALHSLSQSEQRFRELANSIPQLVWIADREGNVYWCNDRWHAYTGMSARQVDADCWLHVHSPDALERVTQMWTHSISSGEPYEGIFPLRSVNGEFRTFYARMVPVKDSTEKIDLWVGTYTDVTDLEKTKERLIRANNRKDEILTMLAHELRNPFSAIQAAAEVLKVSTETLPTIRRASDIIVRQVSHLSTRLDNLLDMADLNRGKIVLNKNNWDIAVLLHHAIEQVQPKINEKKQSLIFEVEEKIFLTSVDGVRMTQVFSNVLLNAIEHTPEWGTVSIKIESEKCFYKVVFEDAGEGINPEVLPYLFELFSQGERSASDSMKGLGLGLALAKNFTDLHGGVIAFEGVGQLGGSRFSISLPALN